MDIENPLYNSNVKWIVIVKNNGPDRATDVKVNEILSDAFELIRFDASKGYYINGIWTIGDLNIGETVSLELITKIIKTGNFINIVNVTGNEYDYNNSNNQANKSVNVDPAIDLEISKKVSNTYPNYNYLVKWTLTVRNNGPDKANSIEITDIFEAFCNPDWHISNSGNNSLLLNINLHCSFILDFNLNLLIASLTFLFSSITIL